MESYRHALYRYSTGQGFNANVDVPENAEDVTSYQFKPLLTRMNMNPDFTVDLRREADRISMQIETTQQVMKNIGSDAKIVRDFQKLNTQLKVIQRLFTHSMRYIRTGDLEKLYQLYEAKTPDIDKAIAQVVKDNIYSTGIYRTKGKPYPNSQVDTYGNKLNQPKEELFLKDKAKEVKTLKGFGEAATSPKLLGPLLLVVLAYLYFRN